MIHVSDLKPLRIPLHSKKSKRCPTCTHILIKPEQKAQSVRFKIKLVAANYLPAITVALPHLQTKRSSKQILGGGATEDAGIGMHAGKTYPFHLALTNPLYDPIQVRLSLQRVHVSSAPPPSEGNAPEKARRPPFALSLPTTQFPVAAFAEAWEYEDDEDMFDVDDSEFGDTVGRRAGREKDGRGGKSKTVGVLERKANVTVVGGEVVIGKEARGNVKVRFFLSFASRFSLCS
jgi:dynactin-4